LCLLYLVYLAAVDFGDHLPRGGRIVLRRRGASRPDAQVLRNPLREIRGIARESERAVVVINLGGGLRRAPHPRDRIDSLVALPERGGSLQCPRHVFGVCIERGRDAGHRLSLLVPLDERVRS
jgi:hypothetical protein